MEREPAVPTTKATADRFTGDVWVDAVTAPRPSPAVAKAGIVRFAPGARSAWHMHARGQALRILDGTAIVASHDGTVIVAGPGTTVYTPPGEWHWHGAAPDAFMSHLAISETTAPDQGPDVTWGDLVGEDDYRASARHHHERNHHD